MANIKLPVQLANGSAHPDEQNVWLGEGLIKKLKLPVRQPITLRFGSLRREVRVQASAQASIRLQEGLAARLGVRQGAVLTAQYRPGARTLVLGPLIGVLVSRVSAKSADKPFGDMTTFCRELSDACAQHGGFVYFFTPEDIEGGASSVSGWTYAAQWTKRTFPAPDVLYNRLTSRKLENLPHVQQFMADVKSRYGSVVFNERYLDKSDVFDALRKEAALSRLLPESHLYKNYAMLQGMCSRHQTVFVKPITGSLGKGIMRISKQPSGGGYLLTQTTVNGVRRTAYPSLPKLFAAVSSQLKARRYQLQQGLRLLTVGERPVDFRALVQRNREGQWAVTSVMARVAADNTFVSNLARGGSLLRVPEALAKSPIPPGDRAAVLAKLRNAALLIAKGVENQIEGHFGELGVDLAVDLGGRVWLIEVNSKPSKDDNTPTEGRIRPSVKQLVLYSQYAAGK